MTNKTRFDTVSHINDTMEQLLVLLEEENLADDPTFTGMTETLREIKQELEEVLETYG